MDRNHVTSLEDNSQRLPTPVPVGQPTTNELSYYTSTVLSQPDPTVLRPLAPRAPSRLLRLPDELKMEIISHLIERVKVHRRVNIKQGRYLDRVMIVHASHVRNSSAFYINKQFTTMLDARYYNITHFTFDFAPSTTATAPNPSNASANSARTHLIRHYIYSAGPTTTRHATRRSLTSTALRHMPFHLTPPHSPLKCYRPDLSESLISSMRHMSLTFSIWSSKFTPGAIIESHHISMINISHAVHVISAYGLRRGILKSLRVEVKVHELFLLVGSEEFDGNGGPEGMIEDLKRVFLVHNGGRRWWRGNLADLVVGWV